MWLGSLTVSAFCDFAPIPTAQESQKKIKKNYIFYQVGIFCTFVDDNWGPAPVVIGVMHQTGITGVQVGGKWFAKEQKARGYLHNTVGERALYSHFEISQLATLHPAFFGYE